MANPLEELIESASAIAKGMGVTFKEMMSPTVTENYPDEPPRFEERYRGVHVLQRDSNGMEKCVACFLCAAACPSNCIYIEAAENTDKVRISGGERYAKVYNIDYNRCIFWRILRRGLSYRRDHAWSRLRDRQLQHLGSGHAKRKHADSAAREL